MNGLSKAGGAWVLPMSTCALLVACGGGDGGFTALSGQVTAQGAAIANAQVVLMNRRTHERYATRTDTQGRYETTLPSGHYDLAVDDGKKQRVLMQSLVTLTGGPSSRDLQLPADGVEPTTVSGRIRLPNGQAAAGYTLWFSSDHGRGDDKGLIGRVRTDEQGQFSLSLGEARAFDLDIHDAEGNFVEFVDAHKLNGHLSLDIVLGTPEQANVYRHNERPEPPESKVTPAAADVSSPFSVSVTADSEVALLYGSVPLSSTQKNLVLGNTDLRDPLAQYSGLSAGDGPGEIQIWAAPDSCGWFGDYSINVRVKAVKSGAFTFNGYTFHDGVDDSSAYNLSVYRTGTHCVGYSSEQPNITEVGIAGSFNIDLIAIPLGLTSAAKAVEEAVEEALPEFGDDLSAVGELEDMADEALNTDIEQLLADFDEAADSPLRAETREMGFPAELLNPELDTIGVRDLYRTYTPKYFAENPEFSQIKTTWANDAIRSVRLIQDSHPARWTKYLAFVAKQDSPAIEAYESLGLSPAEALDRAAVMREVNFTFENMEAMLNP